MTQVLYRKYRPRVFQEVEGQEHVVRTLRGALASGRVGHAYLFCGPRGTGKTTMARLMAKALNCSKRQIESNNVDNTEPCNICHSCNEINESRSLDLIEIDAASNRGIDEIRNLKDSARVAAASGNYKVFIIDEVHMLTPPAFNALLKILEEPPSHIVFILATTEPYKVPETVLSRVQRFDFKKISVEKIQKKLLEVAKKEKLQIDNDALTIIASSASGSMRDAESSLNKLIAYSGSCITDEHVTEVLGIVPFHVHQKLLELVRQKNGQEAIAHVARLYESGVDMDNFVKQFIKYLRSELIGLIGKTVAVSSGQTEIEFLIKTINVFIKAGGELRFSPVPQLPLELAILELTK
ncbi:MAG: DNA polymerase III subunit gamma/tau [Candidatus Yanofskybacteria bacterium]|nr:DNA polymerase III subunit gamma/tau [Candidatus Yanofskybacteria bacterium]